MGIQIYDHVRVVISILLGFSLTHLLRGVARLIQHPRRQKVDFIHLGWTLFIFFYLIHFWWFEFRLGLVGQWTFPLYLFIILYGVLLYLICALLWPDDVNEYDGFRGYFFSRKAWFFGFLSTLWFFDYVDTLIKGRAVLSSLGWEYEIRLILFLGCSLWAMRSKNMAFHRTFVTLGTLYQLSYILRQYFTVS